VRAVGGFAASQRMQAFACRPMAGQAEGDRQAVDAEKERMAILSLVNIVDLRNDEFIRRVRPEGSGCIPHFLSECD
jgi:hypothetical protein